MSKKYIEVALLQLIESVERAEKVIEKLKIEVAELHEEPKVLTAEESFSKEYHENYCSSDFREGYLDGYRNGQVQGRLERDLEFRPLLEAVENSFCDETEEEDPESMFVIFQAFDNIPSLNKK
jgi:FtsZ-binding cell division protein ZapB